MVKAIGIILICLSAIAAVSDTAGYQVATITAVGPHQDAIGADSASYDVSLRIDDTMYVVSYTPPFGADTVRYVAGRDVLVFVGEKTIIFNDPLGTRFELPILSRTTITQPSSSSAVQNEPEPKDPIKSVDVIGLVGVKDNTAGMLTVRASKLHFASRKGTADIDAASIEDVLTGTDSQRALHGTAGTISMFGPYGSGRFLSLFRSKVDILTIQYRDADGGLHGAIFTMAPGKSEPLKKELVAAGARTSIPSQSSAEAASTEASSHTEAKP